MGNSSKYPKVLIIYHSRINKADQHGVSIRGWFGDWPKENLAQIYSGGKIGDVAFCKYNFELKQKERRFGRYFFKLKKSSIGQRSYPINADENFTKIDKRSFWSLLKNKSSEFLINTGLWELIFKPILSKEMMEFVTDFQPQIIYCQGYHLTFAWLPIMVHNKFQIPICFQTGDDWPFYLYKYSPLSIVIKLIVERTVRSLLSKSSVRLANGRLMAEEYYKRYNLSFEPLMMCDNLLRFRDAISHRVVDDSTISIVYSGGLGTGRWQSIIDLCKVSKLIQNEGDIKIMITAFASTIPSEAVNKLLEIDNLQILPNPSHEELPSFLKGADILYLPESFDNIIAKRIHLSISTKAHFYMMSEKPILLYASPVTGIADYAKKGGWACMVNEQDLSKLDSALRKMITNKEYCEKLVSNGLEIVSIDHDESKVRAKFLSILSDFKKQ